MLFFVAALTTPFANASIVRECTTAMTIQELTERLVLTRMRIEITGPTDANGIRIEASCMPVSIELRGRPQAVVFEAYPQDVTSIEIIGYVKK